MSFSGKMDPQEYVRIIGAVRKVVPDLSTSIEVTEAIHEEFFNRQRFPNRESARQEYYRHHPARKDDTIANGKK